MLLARMMFGSARFVATQCIVEFGSTGRCAASFERWIVPLSQGTSCPLATKITSVSSWVAQSRKRAALIFKPTPSSDARASPVCARPGKNRGARDARGRRVGDHTVIFGGQGERLGADP